MFLTGEGFLVLLTVSVVLRRLSSVGRDREPPHDKASESKPLEIMGGSDEITIIHVIIALYTILTRE